MELLNDQIQLYRWEAKKEFKINLFWSSHADTNGCSCQSDHEIVEQIDGISFAEQLQMLIIMPITVCQLIYLNALLLTSVSSSNDNYAKPDVKPDFVIASKLRAEPASRKKKIYSAGPEVLLIHWPRMPQ